MSYRWESFTLDTGTSSLSRHGKRIEVAPRVVDCIGYLIAHRDRVVGHDELIRKLWGHDNVTNHQLAQVVLAARRVLGDDGQQQQRIRTVPGRGYHWVGPLGETVASAESMPDALAAMQMVARFRPNGAARSGSILSRRCRSWRHIEGGLSRC